MVQILITVPEVFVAGSAFNGETAVSEEMRLHIGFNTTWAIIFNAYAKYNYPPASAANAVPAGTTRLFAACWRFFFHLYFLTIFQIPPCQLLLQRPIQ